MSETTYSVQLAKTSRAKCKTSKEPIQKGELKIVVEAPLREGQNFAMSSSHKVSCFKIPRKLASQGVGIEEFVEEYLMDNDDGNLLLDRKAEILDLLRQAAAKKKGSGTSKAKDGSATIMDRLKEAATKEDDTDVREPVPKKAKTKKQPATEEEEFRAMLTLYRKYHKGTTVAELKDKLRWNKQIMGGTKAFVLFKVIDGELHGRLSLCPLCQGDLKFVEGDYDKIHCGGRYDEDIGQRIPCSWTTPRLANPETVRAHPFYTEEPSQAEKDAMDKFKEEAREGGASTADNPVAQKLLQAAKSIQLDLGSDAGRKQAVGEFLALVQGKVDLPQNRNPKMEIGRLVMAHAEKSAEEIMQAILDKWGFADAKEEQAAAKEAAAEAACANPKNAGLILAFGECAKYYFAESNRNAALSYKKAITTLTELQEEVTEANALSFSKGKTKLPGIGKSTAQKMLEFVKTGTFEKLEEKRKAHA